jgi:sarcosine oxidase gamma subunit
MEQQQPVPPHQWYVLIEEQVARGQSIQWSLSATHPAGPDIEQARRLAADTALAHRPQHPKRVEGRQVFRTGPDNWLVSVKGTKDGFHFRVCVGIRTAVATT